MEEVEWSKGRADVCAFFGLVSGVRLMRLCTYTNRGLHSLQLNKIRSSPGYLLGPCFAGWKDSESHEDVGVTHCRGLSMTMNPNWLKVATTGFGGSGSRSESNLHIGECSTGLPTFERPRVPKGE